jgi:hypothetical protein
MQPKQRAGDYFVSYTRRNFSVKHDKLHVGRIIDTFSSAFCFINSEQKIAEILTFYQSNSSWH